MTSRAILESARSLLLHEGVWIKGCLAANEDGRQVDYWSPRACKFSLKGAILRVAYITRQPAGNAFRLVAARVCPGTRQYVTVEAWNDSLGVDLVAVITVLNDVIVSLGGTSVSPYGDEDE